VPPAPLACWTPPFSLLGRVRFCEVGEVLIDAFEACAGLLQRVGVLERLSEARSRRHGRVASSRIRPVPVR
jgi:hypothetical protein